MEEVKTPALQERGAWAQSVNPILESWSRDTHDFVIMVELQLG